MNDQSPNFNRGKGPNWYFNSPLNKNNSQGMKQPLHLAPHSPHLSPRKNFNKRPGLDNNSQSPDFIPIGFSSPLNVYKNIPNNNWNQERNNSWNRGNNTHFQNRSSFGSSTSSPRSSVSSNYSPYNKFGSNRGRGGFKNKSSSSGNISIADYCDKSMLENPWEEFDLDLVNDISEKSKANEMSSDTCASSEGSESESNPDANLFK